MPESRPLLDTAVTALAPAVWGSTYLVTTEFLPPDRPVLAAVARALPAGLVLLAFTRVLPTGGWWWRATVLGVLNIGLFLPLLFVAAYLLPGGPAALLLSMQPALVLLLGVPLLGRAIRLPHTAACALGAVGVALLVLEPGAALDAVGVLAAIGGAFSMAFGIVLTKKWGRPDGVGVLPFTGWQLTVGGLVLLPLLLAEGLPDRLTGANLGGFLYLGVVGALLSYLLWFRGLARLPASTVSFLALVSPLVAAVLGWVVLGEAFTLRQLLGGLLIAGAILLAQLVPAPAREPRRKRTFDEAETVDRQGG
ncbi:EamA family transporter [Streptomyces calidiresistens]|uniref:EamA family transporter n=1 Tax=Streptomyces calidiresistens TaxID=1485586 RepID=A0A7W3T2Z3_9ACTN|nr:EamA family transporter [Streptomyces calidiresistens]MBB0229994.1 EamA family transporter [Streptomyces calidiresistens]